MCLLENWYPNINALLTEDIVIEKFAHVNDVKEEYNNCLKPRMFHYIPFINSCILGCFCYTCKRYFICCLFLQVIIYMSNYLHCPLSLTRKLVRDKNKKTVIEKLLMYLCLYALYFNSNELTRYRKKTTQAQHNWGELGEFSLKLISNQ